MTSIYYNQQTGNFRFVTIVNDKILWETKYGDEEIDFEFARNLLSSDFIILLGYL